MRTRLNWTRGHPHAGARAAMCVLRRLRFLCARVKVGSIGKAFHHIICPPRSFLSSIFSFGRGTFFSTASRIREYLGSVNINARVGFAEQATFSRSCFYLRLRNTENINREEDLHGKIFCCCVLFLVVTDFFGSSFDG